MKRTASVKSWLFASALAVLGSSVCTQAGSFVSDFNSGLPAGSAVYGAGAVLASGGYTNSGLVQLTPDQASTAGSFVITNDLDKDNFVTSFTATFKVWIGGGARFGYGDGMSFNFAPDVPLGSDGLAEQGVGSGLRVGIRTTKDASAPNPAISVSVGGTPAEGSPAYPANLRANTFVDMVVQLNPNQTISVIYDGAYIYSNKALAYIAPQPGSLFWIGARCGSAHEKHLIDNLQITTRTTYPPFVNSFAPRGRQVPANGSLDILLTDYATQVNTNTVALSLDGVAVSPAITQDGLGNTAIHFAPANPFVAASQHSVRLSFGDTAVPAETQSFSWQFTVSEAMPTNLVTVFSDNFESYHQGTLDKNTGGGDNAAPNGSGNPWFGPYPDNYTVLGADALTVDGTNVNVRPHSGTNMMTKSYVTYTCTLWMNLAYRCHGGLPIHGNCQLDWWQFDANDPNNAFKDYASLYCYNPAAYGPAVTVPQTADWPANWDRTAGMWWEQNFAWGDTDYQSLSLGTSGYSQKGGYYDPTKYQIRSEEMTSGITYGIDGWVNVIDRSQGWHHHRIVMGPPHANGTGMVYFFIDDMETPVYSGLSTIAASGISLLEIDSLSNTPSPAVPAYYDDVSFALVRPPNLVFIPSGSNMILTWPGEGFTLQSASDVKGPWSDVAGAASGYSYNTTSGSKQFFRLRN